MRVVTCLLLLALLAPDLAWASDIGRGLPWETPLATIRDSVTGPVAYAISMLGIVVAGAMLIWGGEINEFARRVIMLVLVISLIVAASNILKLLFTSAAVLI